MSQPTAVSSPESNKTRKLCLLALDGGGVRGLSSLLLLKQLMERIDSQNPPKPCACFDMIGGTSTGGLIAIMLGRLGMSVDECIEVYKKLSPEIFTKVHHRVNIKGEIQGRFDDKALEAGVKALLANRGWSEDELLKQNDACKTFVCATSQTTGSTVVLSTYYSSRRGADMWKRVKIWQAARATSAASSFFDPIMVDGEGFVDGATGANNPIQELWTEASDVWREGSNWRLEDNVRCLVSIGTGIPTSKPFPSNAMGVGKALVAIATDTENVADMFQKHHTNLYRERRAFRFNVIHGLENVGLEEAKREGEIMAATRRYIQSENVFTAMKDCVEKLCQWVLPILDTARLNEFLRILSVIDQEKHKSTIPDIDPDQPEFYWIFRNSDFTQWQSCKSSQTLWLSGPSQCGINRVSSFIAENGASEGSDSILYFFCSTATREKLAEMKRSTATIFIHTILAQFIGRSAPQKKLLAATAFLRALLKAHLAKLAAPDTWDLPSNRRELVGEMMQKILDKQPSEPWDALIAALTDEVDRGLFIVIDGLDEVVHRDSEFIGGIHRFLSQLQQTGLKVKAFITSRPHSLIKDILAGYPNIEYDKERKECLASLYFENTRYGQVQEAHEGTFEWLWGDEDYNEWLTAKASRLLCVTGKPGSGKSTLTKYFKENFCKQEPDATPTIIAHFFYSDRAGELQRSHYNMLRSILYGILSRNASFFHHFQSAHRSYQASLGDIRHDHHEKLHYKLLKKVLLSLADHPQAEQLHLIIDAVDESDLKDRENILLLLRDLCLKSKLCVFKVFIASRPPVSLEKAHNHITIHHKTEESISKLVNSTLKDLNLGVYLNTARNYIIKTAEGVFVWVRFVLDELKKLDSSENVIELLEKLPPDLDGIYKRSLDNLKNQKHPPEFFNNAIRIFQFTLYAGRPLTASELQHALAITANPNTSFTLSDEHLQRQLTGGIKEYIADCGRNLVEVRAQDNAVQFMHQTAREFFLRPSELIANTEFRMDKRDAHISISITCIRYLMLCITGLINNVPGVKNWPQKVIEFYARYLDEKPLAAYALRYLRYHIDQCRGAKEVSSLLSQLVLKLADNSMTSLLLKNWATELERASIEESVEDARKFKRKLLHTAIKLRLPRTTEMLLIVKAPLEDLLLGKPPLLVSAESGDDVTARVLLRYKANANARDKLQRTPLRLAAEHGHEAVTRLLLETGADINEKDGLKKTALHLAVEHRHEAVVQLLLASRVDVNTSDQLGKTALHLAVESGHEAVTRLLLESGANVNEKDRLKKTALHLAVEHGHDAVTQLLLENGADVNEKDPFGKTALHLAVEHGHEAVTQLLLEYEANVNEKDRLEKTALHLAVERGREEVTLLLLENEANVNEKDRLKKTALHLAVEHGHGAVTQLLLEYEANVNEKDRLEKTALHLAVKHGHEAVTQLLLENGADVNVGDRLGNTALHLAVKHGHKAVTRLLLKSGAGVNREDPIGKTALRLAVEHGHKVVTQLLLENGANVHEKTHAEMWHIYRDGGGARKTILQLAVECDYKAITQSLLENGADVNEKDPFGNTALHLAVERGNGAVTQLLLENGADVNKKNPFRKTALHLAVEHGNRAVAQLLLENGADADEVVQVEDSRGPPETLLQLAEHRAHKGIAELLIENRAYQPRGRPW
ncbi:MAG: hypothetical protein M1839_001735 [Geoglossum umbratile]|nr:MAG: hypothetical protein M1839_001735 [Geoglossum umbratile]